MKQQFKIGDRAFFYDTGGFLEGRWYNKKVCRRGVVVSCTKEILGGWQGNKEENIYGIKVDFLGGSGFLGVGEEQMKKEGSAPVEEKYEKKCWEPEEYVFKTEKAFEEMLSKTIALYRL